jgi:glycosyltransferase involved in cell wall biosynthesis
MLTPDGPVTFVIPALNAAATLGRCLDAILAADTCGRPRAVLVLDNGSTDRTAAIAEQRGARVVRADGLTIAALRNLGVRLAEGEIVAFVDSDCVIASAWLARGLPHFADPSVGAVGAPTEIPPDATWVQRAWSLHRHRGTEARRVDWLPTENLMIGKSAFEDVGGFNEDLITCEDVDFCYRLGSRHAIVSDPSLRSIHLGEAPTLARFFRKEAWRGRGNLAGFLAHGFHRSELPSVLLPLYYLAGAAGLIAAFGYGAATGHLWPVALGVTLLLVPSMALATMVAIQARRLHDWPQLTVLYLTYAMARAAAIVADLQRASLRPAMAGSTPRRGSGGA